MFKNPIVLPYFMTELTEVMKSQRKIWTLDKVEQIVFPDGVGPTDIERFFNAVIGDKYLLHGSTEYIDGVLNPGKNKRFSATDNAGIALMYALHTNKGSFEGISSVGRGWELAETSSDLTLTLEYEMDHRFQHKFKEEGYENAAVRLAKTNMKDKGYIYLVERKDFNLHKATFAEFRTKKQQQYLKCFEVKRDWFKGEVYSILIGEVCKVRM